MATLIPAAEADAAVLVYRDTPVITSAKLADLYGVNQKKLRNNLERNRDRFVEGKHYFQLSGQEARAFVRGASFRGSPLQFASTLNLWTERGAARHAKLLNSERAWDVFETLEDTYFRVRAAGPALPLPNDRSALPSGETERLRRQVLSLQGQLLAAQRRELRWLRDNERRLRQLALELGGARS